MIGSIHQQIKDKGSVSHQNVIFQHRDVNQADEHRRHVISPDFPLLVSHFEKQGIHGQAHDPIDQEAERDQSQAPFEVQIPFGEGDQVGQGHHGQSQQNSYHVQEEGQGIPAHDHTAPWHRQSQIEPVQIPLFLYGERVQGEREQLKGSHGHQEDGGKTSHYEKTYRDYQKTDTIGFHCRPVQS